MTFSFQAARLLGSAKGAGCLCRGLNLSECRVHGQVVLPDGDADMSPRNRTNPGLTTSTGEFRWDVLGGWYVVEASKPGCQSAYTTELKVPAPVLGLVLVLDCRGPDDIAPVVELVNPPADYPPSGDVTVNYTITDNSGEVSSQCVADDQFVDCGSSWG